MYRLLSIACGEGESVNSGLHSWCVLSYSVLLSNLCLMSQALSYVEVRET